MEYINKQQILEKAKQHQNSPFAASLIIAEIEKADDGLVRCKYCKHYEQGNSDKEDWGYCWFNDTCFESIGFCSYGERRDNNG